jgi:hypothetical protein
MFWYEQKSAPQKIKNKKAGEPVDVNTILPTTAGVVAETRTQSGAAASGTDSDMGAGHDICGAR